VESSLHELSKDVVEDAAVLEVTELWLSVNSNLSLEFLSSVGGNINDFTDLQLSTIGGNIESLFACETERLSILAWKKLKRENSHTNQVRSVNTLVGLGYNSLNALEIGTLSSPIS
jgi:hypothetical protein